MKKPYCAEVHTYDHQMSLNLLALASGILPSTTAVYLAAPQVCQNV